MPLFLLLLALLGAATRAAAQEPQAPLPGQPPPVSAPAPATLALERIRRVLTAPTELQLRNVDERPDFTVQIDEQRMIDEMLASMDFKTGPAPAGGLYGYEQQRMLSKLTNNPLMQPYAAFSAGEFFTIAAENLARVYLQDKVKRGVSQALRSRAETSARREVDADIAAYCADQVNPAVIELCSGNPSR